MQVKLKGERWGERAGTDVAVADYEGRRLIEQDQAEPATGGDVKPKPTRKKAPAKAPASHGAKQE